MSAAPEIRRVRHETRRRQLRVKRVEHLGSTMLRVVAAGEELQGFTSLGFDDHVKLFFSGAELDAGTDGQPAMRDFTPRRHDPVAGELWIDFYLHDDGPAGKWAAQAAVDQNITVGGPRGSAIIPLEGIDTHLLIGDETALPAIGRRLEELPAGVRAICVVETSDGQAGYPLTSQSAIDVHWVQRNVNAASPADGLIETLRKTQLPSQRCFAWAALEMQGARAIRRYLIEERGFDKHWVKAAAYWQRDHEGIHAVISDEA